VSPDDNICLVIIKCVFKMLSVYGNTIEFNNVGFQPKCLQNLIEYAIENKDCNRSPKVWEQLFVCEIPKYRSIIMEELSINKALEDFFMVILPEYRDNYGLVTICLLLSTFAFRVQGYVPNIDYSLLIETCTFTMRNLINNPFCHEFCFYCGDFLDGCSMYIDSSIVEPSLSSCIDWKICIPFLEEERFFWLRNANPISEDEYEYIQSIEPIPTLFEQLFEFAFTYSMDSIRKNEESDNEFAIHNIITMIQLCVSITSQKFIGDPVAYYVMCAKINGQYFYPSFLDEITSFNQFNRRIVGLDGRLRDNLSKYFPSHNIPKYTTSLEYRKIIGIDSQYIDDQYLIDFLSSNMYIPRMVLNFLDVESFAIASFILFKQSFALNLWEDIVLAFDESGNSGGTLNECESFAEKGELWIKTKSYINDGRFILLNVEDFCVNQIAFAEKASVIGMKIKVKILSGPVNEEYNFVYEMDPKNASTFQMLSNSSQLEFLYKEYSDSELTKFWIGGLTDDGVIKVQTSLINEEKPDEINFGGIIENPVELMSVIYSCQKQFSVPPKVYMDQFFEYRADISIPCDSKNVIVRYQKVGGHRMVPDGVKYTKDQQLAVFSSIFFPITVVQGPPGTGKSETMLAITRCLHENIGLCIDNDGNEPQINKRILVCAHSNMVLDQMIESIVDSGIDVFRYGKGFTSPKSECLTVEGRLISILRELSEFCESSTELQMEYSDLYSVLQEISDLKDEQTSTIIDVINEYKTSFKRAIDMIENVISSLNENQEEFFENLDYFFNQLKVFLVDNQKKIDFFISGLTVIGATISGASFKLFELQKYNTSTIIIEESAKIVETEMLQFLLLHPTRIIMIGDHAQIAPIIKCDDVRYYGRFGVSFFERMIRCGVQTIQLTSQGRAKSDIADLYRSRYSIPLTDLPCVNKLPDAPPLDVPIQWVNVVCTNMIGKMRNQLEAEMIANLIILMKSNGYDSQKISVLTPYNNQKAFLSSYFKERSIYPRDVSTIDEFQGLQNYLILVSLVSPKPSIWLRDTKRITVLSSRSRSAIIFFGNMDGFNQAEEWSCIISTIDKKKKAGYLYANGKQYSDLSCFKESYF